MTVEVTIEISDEEASSLRRRLDIRKRTGWTVPSDQRRFMSLTRLADLVGLALPEPVEPIKVGDRVRVPHLAHYDWATDLEVLAIAPIKPGSDRLLAWCRDSEGDLDEHDVDNLERLP